MTDFVRLGLVVALLGLGMLVSWRAGKLTAGAVWVGGALGLLLAVAVLHLLNGSHLIPYAHLGLNARVFGLGLGLTLLFGLLSGAYPAYKMSKMPANQALKGRIAA